jgi:dihydropteroate synthase
MSGEGIPKPPSDLSPRTSHLPPSFDWGPFLAKGPLFIGILNVTPDSFSDGGRYTTAEAAVAQARALVTAGARMLDVGAESTRPGAAPVDEDQEWRRLEPVLEVLRMVLPEVPLSLDTRHAEVARRGLVAGVSVLNDVTGFSDPAMLDLAQAHSCGLIAMRSRFQGDRLWMPAYGGADQGDAEGELRLVRDRLLKGGIAPSRVLLDPGFGFGTTFAGDCALWESLPHLPADRFCLGLSRKRFLAWRKGSPDLPATQRDGLTAEAHTQAQGWGYRVFRTHALGE